MSSQFKCIIFDCDGVLVDSEAIGNSVIVDLANTLGANIDLNYAYRNFKGESFNDIMQKIERLTGKELPANFEDTYRTTSFEAFRKNIKPIDGVLELVNDLKIPFCVASSGPEPKIRLNLELTGLLPYFKDHIFSCYAIQKWKPDPAVFLWAANEMGFEPQGCLVVEDSIVGVKAAKLGGFKVAGYTEHDYNNQLTNLVDFSFSTMSDLKAFLKQ
ncbi:HAD family hydrolase [Psychroserpens sp.]|uniref:HAD family hydrolase n=1 Tax=Psychroserpens sp. TaxID=2020870 RepID=UPI003C749D5A